MKEAQREKLKEYLSRDDIEIYSISFICGGNVSSDTLTINFYGEENNERFIFCSEVDKQGKENLVRRAKVFK